MKFVVEPLHAQRETVGRIVDFLIYHANRFTSPGIDTDQSPVDSPEYVEKRGQLLETKSAARVLASELMVRTQAVPLYGTLEKLGIVRKRSNIRTAQRNLFFIHNAMFDRRRGIENYECGQRIEEALGIETEFKIEADVDRPAQEPE